MKSAKSSKSSSAAPARRGAAPLPTLHENAAGIDVGSREHYAAVPADRGPVRAFGCYTRQLQAMAAWLRECSVTTVALESTGVYWVPIFEVLEDAGFHVILVDARQTKNVAGRKSDVQDCQWIQQLHSYGLLAPAFRPERGMAVLRSYWRHRDTIVQSASRHIHLMQKALEQMNVQLHKAVTGITGHTGRKIIEALIAGERDCLARARLRHPLVKSTEAEIAQALSGTFREEHLFALRQAYQAFVFFQDQLATCDGEIQAHMSTLASKPSPDPAEPLPAPPPRRKNQPHFNLREEQRRIAGVDLCTIPGIDTLTAQHILTECGAGMSRFPSDKHFASWLGLCPNHRITGGAIRSRRSRTVKQRAATALRISAQSLHRSKTSLGAYYRRMRTRLGAPKAITATAHKLATLVYQMLKHGTRYVERGQDYYETQYRKRREDALKKTPANWVTN